MSKAPQRWSTCRRCDVTKLHTIVARHAFQRQNVQNLRFGALLGVEMSKSARRCGTKHILKSECTKTPRPRSTFGKMHAAVARSTFRSQNVQNTSTPEHFWKNALRCGAKHMTKSKCAKCLRSGTVRITFGSWDVQKKHAASKCEKHNKFGTLSNIVKRVGFFVFSKTLKNDGRRATSAKMHVAWQAQYKRHPRHVRRSGSRFPERGCILEHQIFRSAKMILHDSHGHGTSYDLVPLFRGKRSTLETWDRTIAKRIRTRPLALHSTV